MEYRVSWTIDIDADCPEDAARQALEIHRDQNSWATHFAVQDSNGQKVNVDLGFPVQTPRQDLVYVAIPLDEGIVRGVQAYFAKTSAEAYERDWLAERELLDSVERERAADWGTGIAIWPCDVAA